MRLSVVIPCFNEEHKIANTVDQINTFLETLQFDFEIIVVNDGSSDNTRDTAKSLDVVLVDYDDNMGKGYAVKKGVERSSGDYILFIDADHTISIAHIDLFLKSIDNSDVVIASKYMGKANHVSFLRKMLGKTFAAFRKVITGLRYKDTQCGFKLFKSEVAKDLFSKLSVYGWCFDVEILILAKKSNYQVIELPVNLDKTIGGSQIHLVSSSIKMLIDLIKIRLKHL
jgi:glycosyltransferase involved in cell wall biosynthesis